MIPKPYRLKTGRPHKNDLVYVPSQDAVFTVVHVDRMNVKIERSHKGSGLFMVLPPSQYILVEEI